MSGTKASLFSSWGCRCLYSASERGIVYSSALPRISWCCCCSECVTNAGSCWCWAAAPICAQHWWGVKAPGRAQSPRKAFQRGAALTSLPAASSCRCQTSCFCWPLGSTSSIHSSASGQKCGSLGSCSAIFYCSKIFRGSLGISTCKQTSLYFWWARLSSHIHLIWVMRRSPSDFLALCGSKKLNNWQNWCW